MNGGPFFPQSAAPPFGNRNAGCFNGTGAGNLRFEQYKQTMPYQQQKGASFLPPPVLQQQNLRRTANPTQTYNSNNRTAASTTTSAFGTIGCPIRSSASDVSSLSSGTNGSQRFSRKVFVGGLPPDIDEGDDLVFEGAFAAASFYFLESLRLCTLFSVCMRVLI